MTSEYNGTHTGAERLAQVAATIGRYPKLSTDELQMLKSWFKSEATALDVALLASQDDIKNGYATFREHHLDRLGGKEIAATIAVLMLVLLCAVLVAA